MRLTNANNDAVKYACLKFHYAKAIPVNPIAYNVYNGNNEWCGCILYARGAAKNIGKPYGLQIGEVLELVRVALNGKQECTSQAVAMSLKQLKKDCPYLRLVVSYADADQNHLGTIYQATNWIYVGHIFSRYIYLKGRKRHPKSIYSLYGREDMQWLKDHIDPNARYIDSDGKRKYLMPMDKKMRKQIEPLRQPYPKTDADWQKIDRNKFKHGGNGTKKETN